MPEEGINPIRDQFVRVLLLECHLVREIGFGSIEGQETKDHRSHRNQKGRQHEPVSKDTLILFE